MWCFIYGAIYSPSMEVVVDWWKSLIPLHIQKHNPWYFPSPHLKSNTSLLLSSVLSALPPLSFPVFILISFLSPLIWIAHLTFVLTLFYLPILSLSLIPPYFSVCLQILCCHHVLVNFLFHETVLVLGGFWHEPGSGIPHMSLLDNYHLGGGTWHLCPWLGCMCAFFPHSLHKIHVP